VETVIPEEMVKEHARAVSKSAGVNVTIPTAPEYDVPAHRGLLSRPAEPTTSCISGSKCVLRSLLVDCARDLLASHLPVVLSGFTWMIAL
jgi:hypothetical protein